MHSIDSERWLRIRTVLDRALETPPGARAALLEELCGDDADLRAEVESLLAAEAGAGALLEAPVAEYAGALLDEVARVGPEPDPWAGRRIGAYRLVRQLARGGMGTIYLAERADGEYEQQVAIKLLRPGLDTDDLLRRFVAERQILASLSHPNIARLLDGGATDEARPYLVMEYVAGEPIDAYCDRNRLSIEHRLSLFLAVARTVQHAHRNLVVHRDLKPGNILVSTAGEVKLLDFGIAKLLQPSAADAESMTRTGARLLTPGYASPEQVKGDPVTTASDVYQLGLLLYELLTGQRPYRVAGRTPAEVERTVCEQEPPRPSAAVMRPPEGEERDGPRAAAAARRTTQERLGHRLRGDLDSITLVALRKEPERRYASVEAFAEDIERHRAGLPVRACGASRAYRARRFVQRHRVGVATTAGVLLLVAGLVGYYTQRLARERDAAEQSAVLAEAEAERAAAALVETEQMLARAETLHEFLLGLFRAAQPDRPRDQLPSTEELLALGARRALDEQAAAPADRLGMLLTIGQVYIEQNRFEQARPLIESAVALARADRALRPGDLARALYWQGALAWRGGGPLADAEAPLLEAESLTAPSERLWNTFALARSTRGWVEFLKGNRVPARDLLEPLYEQIAERDDTDPAVQYHVASQLASVYHRLGELEAAADLHAEASELAKRVYGPESLIYAINLSNRANVEREVGRFEAAESAHRQAIALYDAIYGEQPMEFRAVAHRNLARTLLVVGRFEEALATLHRATVEGAETRGLPAARYDAHFFYRGKWSARMHRWQAAETDLRRARGLMTSLPQVPARSLSNAEALVAWTYCHQGNLVEAEAILAAMDARLDGSLPDDPRERAQVHESRATCYFRAGRLEPALGEIDLALAAVTQPGRAMDRAGRKILRARILAAMDRTAEVESVLEEAETLYRDVGLVNHPLFADIEAARRELRLRRSDR